MRTGKDLFSFSVWSEYSVVENWLGGQPRNTLNTRNEDQGMRTGKDPILFFRVVRVFRGKKIGPVDRHQRSRIAITENPQAFFVVFEYSVVESFSDNLLILCG